MKRLRYDDAAVVVVDIQIDFCHEDGYQERRGNELARVQSAVVRIDLSAQ